MRDEAGEIAIFTSEMIETMASIWMRSSISLVDVRHTIIHPERPMQHYRMPSSMLVYAYGGSANVQLNETIFDMERFGVFHGGKGTTLSISPDNAALESFMVLYKAETPSFFQKDLQRLLEQVNPFVQRFGYAPSNPVRLIGLFQQMMNSWGCSAAMSRFHTKNLFNQALHEIYRDLQREEAKFLQPDPVIAAKRYLDEHYMQPIMFQEIADMFAISGGQLTRLFKKREGKSLQAYLAWRRLEDARYHLLHTNATVKEIALGCGLVDELNLIRIFKRHYKMTPSEYRKIKIMSMQGLDIDNASQRLYNEGGPDSLVESQRDGELIMFGQTRSKELILAVAMSLLLLLSACGTSTPANNNGAGVQTTPPQAVATQAPQAATAEAAWPRTYTDATGAEVVIDKQPQRIAVLHYLDIERLYALGVTPVASVSAEFAINNSLTLEPIRNKGLIDLGDITSPSLETLTEVQPDLIIAWDRHREMREAMEKIAPVIEISYPKPYNETHYIREMGKLLGKEEDAEKLIVEREAKIAEARKQLASTNETAVFLAADVGGIYGVDGLESTRFYSSEGEGLGLKAPDQLPAVWSEISLEGLAEMNPDHLFINMFPANEEDYNLMLSELSKSAVWNSLPAVQNKQVYPIEESTYRGGVLGMYLLSDQAVETLLK